MKKRVLMLLMAVVMMLGMSFTSMADEVKYYDGVIDWIFPSTAAGQGDSEEIAVTATLTDDTFQFEFTDSNGNYVEWKGESMYQPDFFNVVYMNINGEKTNTGAGAYFNSDFSVASINSRGFFSIERVPFRFDAEFHLKEDSTEQENYQISAPFTGAAESDTSSYTLALAGYYTAELTDGTHVLSASDITAQTIAIVAYNKANGVKRVMRETTIEEMTVTVSGGTVTEYIIRGRVQTDGGTLDRYTATINP